MKNDKWRKSISYKNANNFLKIRGKPEENRLKPGKLKADRVKSKEYREK